MTRQGTVRWAISSWNFSGETHQRGSAGDLQTLLQGLVLLDQARLLQKLLVEGGLLGAGRCQSACVQAEGCIDRLQLVLSQQWPLSWLSCSSRPAPLRIWGCSEGLANSVSTLRLLQQALVHIADRKTSVAFPHRCQ